MSGLVEIVLAAVGDVPNLLSLQKEAFISEAELYNDYEIAPLVENEEMLRSAFVTHTILKAQVPGARVI